MKVKPFKKGSIACNLRNERLRDIEKWDCKYRDKCLEEYIRYQAIPCKNCRRYERDPEIEKKMIRELLYNKKYHRFIEHAFY